MNARCGCFGYSLRPVSSFALISWLHNVSHNFFYFFLCPLTYFKTHRQRSRDRYRALTSTKKRTQEKKKKKQNETGTASNKRHHSYTFQEHVNRVRVARCSDGERFYLAKRYIYTFRNRSSAAGNLYGASLSHLSPFLSFQEKGAATPSACEPTRLLRTKRGRPEPRET